MNDKSDMFHNLAEQCIQEGRVVASRLFATMLERSRAQAAKISGTSRVNLTDTSMGMKTGALIASMVELFYRYEMSSNPRAAREWIELCVFKELGNSLARLRYPVKVTGIPS